MRIPNFDDIDLAIIAITCIVAIVCFVVGILLLLNVEPTDILQGMFFVTAAIGTIGGLARGKNGNGNNDVPPDPPPKL